MKLVLLGILEVKVIIHGPPLGGHEGVLRRIDGNAIQPGIEGAIAAKRLQCAIRLDECLLCNVLSLGRIVHVSHD